MLGPILILLAEISKFYGSSCTSSSLQNHFARVINPDLKLFKAAVSAGNDPEHVQLSYIKKINGCSDNGQILVLFRALAFSFSSRAAIVFAL